MGLRLGIGIMGLDWVLELGFVIRNWGLGTRNWGLVVWIGDWDWELGLGIGDLD